MDRVDLTPLQLASMTAVMLLGFAASLGMPFNIDAIASSFAISRTVAGLVASAEMAAIAAGNLMFARLAPRLNPRPIFMIGLVVISMANVASVLTTATAGLVAARVLSGVCLGAVVATVMTTAGRSRHPETTFGFINAMVGAMGVLLAFLLPRALNLHQVLPASPGWSEVDGLYLVYGACAAVALGFVPGTPVPPRRESPPAGATPRPGLRIGWLALLGVGLIFCGHASLSLFIVTIGRAVPLAPEAIGYVFMVGSVVGIVAPLLAAYVGSRGPALRPLALILLVLCASALALAAAGTAAQFYAAAPLFAMLPVAIMPLLLGALARLDPSGSLTGAHPAFVLIGVALAPFIGGALSDLGGFLLTGWFVVGCVVAGGLLGLPAVRRADRERFSGVLSPA